MFLIGHQNILFILLSLYIVGKRSEKTKHNILKLLICARSMITIFVKNFICILHGQPSSTLIYLLCYIIFLSDRFISHSLKNLRGWPSPARRRIANPLVLRPREFESPSSRKNAIFTGEKIIYCKKWSPLRFTSKTLLNSLIQCSIYY